MDGYRVFVNGRPFIVYARTQRAAARTVSFHYYIARHEDARALPLGGTLAERFYTETELAARIAAVNRSKDVIIAGLAGEVYTLRKELTRRHAETRAQKFASAALARMRRGG